MKKHIICLSLLMALLTGCKEQGFQMYESGRYISFEQSVADTTLFSFFFYSEDEVRFPLALRLTGVPFEKDTKFKLVADNNRTTLDKQYFELDSEYTFRAGEINETIHITLKNGAALKNTTFILSLALESNENVYVNTGLYSRQALKVSDVAVKPAWWTQNPIEWYYLGKYSDYKYELFIRETGVSDLEGMPLNQVRVYALQFKRWLADQNPKIWDDENSEEMKVTVVGD